MSKLFTPCMYCWSRKTVSSPHTGRISAAEDTALRAVIFMTIFSYSVLLDTTFSRLVFFVTVTCPCSSTTKCHINLFVYNNNNNNNNHLFVGDNHEVLMTRTLNVTPHTTEQHSIVCSGKSEAAVIIKHWARGRPIVLLKLSTDIHKASRGLSATADFIVSHGTVDVYETCVICAYIECR